MQIFGISFQLNLSTTHGKLMRMGVGIEGMGLGKCRAKLHMHRIITSIHPLIRHENKVIANTRSPSLHSSLLADIFLSPAYIMTSFTEHPDRGRSSASVPNCPINLRQPE